MLVLSTNKTNKPFQKSPGVNLKWTFVIFVSRVSVVAHRGDGIGFFDIRLEGLASGFFYFALKVELSPQ